MSWHIYWCHVKHYADLFNLIETLLGLLRMKKHVRICKPRLTFRQDFSFSECPVERTATDFFPQTVFQTVCWFPFSEPVPLYQEWGIHSYWPILGNIGAGAAWLVYGHHSTAVWNRRNGGNKICIAAQTKGFLMPALALNQAADGNKIVVAAALRAQAP